MKQGTIYAAMCALTVSWLLTSCDHKDLCFNHDDHALIYQTQLSTQYEQEWQYHYNGTDWLADWPANFGMTYESLLPPLPTGLRVVTYNSDGSHNIANLPPEGDMLYFSAGEHSMLFYNNDTEFIIFDGLDGYASAKATTRSRSRSSYLGNTFSENRNENTVNPPDVLYGNYLAEFKDAGGTEPQQLSIIMRPLVFSYLVRYDISEGLEYVALARGALAGMAESVYLNSGTTSVEDATILYDCTVESFGAQAIVRSFGVPDFPNEHYSRGNRKYALNLEVRLRNGKILSYDFDVTDQVAAQPRGGVITVGGIVIPEEAAQTGGSGFDVEVSDWGEFQDIDLDL